MEGTNIAHALPELYRGVLDVVAALAAQGHRHEADRVRAAATAVYSGSWTDAAYGRLDALRLRAERVNGGLERPRRQRPANPAVNRFRVRFSRAIAA